MAQIAADIDWHTAERLRQPPLIVSGFGQDLKQSREVLSWAKGAAASGDDQTAAHLTLLQYIRAVQARDEKLQAGPDRRPRRIVKRAAAKPRRKPSVAET